MYYSDDGGDTFQANSVGKLDNDPVSHVLRVITESDEI